MGVNVSIYVQYFHVFCLIFSSLPLGATTPWKKKRETWDDMECHLNDIKEHNPPANTKTVIMKNWDEIYALFVPQLYLDVKSKCDKVRKLK